MPFKTKRQKLAAAQRRFTFSQLGTVSYETEKEHAAVASDGKRKTPVQKEQREIENLSYVKFDLIKIVLGATIIIFVQIVLSLTLP